MFVSNVINKINNIEKLIERIRFVFNSKDPKEKLKDCELGDIATILITYKDYLQKKLDSTEIDID